MLLSMLQPGRNVWTPQSFADWQLMTSPYPTCRQFTQTSLVTKNTPSVGEAEINAASSSTTLIFSYKLDLPKTRVMVAGIPGYNAQLDTSRAPSQVKCRRF